MKDTDKAIEIIKAAMEKEKAMKDISKESMDETIDTETNEKDANISQAETEKEKIDNLENEVQIQETETLEETEEDTQEDNQNAKQTKSAKSLFKNSKSKEIAAKDQKIEELTDRLMRNMAEFDNFRKRSEKEKAQMFDIGAKSIIEKMLPIIDNFERGLSAISEKEKESSFAQGIELIYKQLVNALEDMGVKPIDAVGKEFDPALHNAVMHGEDDSLGENIVSDEFQKGYTYRDMVIRHSMVKVVN